jgi:ribose transport system permease protein
VIASPSARVRSDALAGTAEVIQRHGVWVALAFAVTVGVIWVPAFATLDNATAVARVAAALGIVAVGQTFVVLTAGIDLSAGMLMGLVVVLTNGIMNGDAALIPAVVALGIVVGIVVGLTNGVIIVATRVQPLIVTLGMLSILQGAIFVYTDRTVGAAPPEFRELAYGSVGPIPNAFILMAAVAIVGALVLAWTPFGRYIYALGGDASNARRAGIPVARIRVGAYVVSGLAAGIAGILLAARLGSGFPLAGQGFELNAVVAVVLGGTALSGGRGGVGGTIAAVFLLAIIGNVLNLLGISPFVQQLVNGLVIVLAVALSTAGRRRA